MTEQLSADRAQLRDFIGRLFRYADDGTWVSLRGFPNKAGAKPPKVRGVLINGNGLDEVSSAAARSAEWCIKQGVADEGFVFAPPIATFSDRYKADTDHLANGLALSVECDQRPNEARARLEMLLGPATVVVASGGEWLDPESGEVQDKLHLHWRLTEQTRSKEDHERLYRVRGLAMRLVGSDATAVPPVHPLRWPGSWHTKGKPRLCHVVGGNEAAEIELDDALALIAEAYAAAGLPEQDSGGEHASGAPLAEISDLADAVEQIPNDFDLMAPSECWNAWTKRGMALHRATGGCAAGFDIFEKWSARSSKYDHDGTVERWEHWFKHPSRNLGAGSIFFWAKQAKPGWEKPSDLRRRASRTESAQASRSDPGHAGRSGRSNGHASPLHDEDDGAEPLPGSGPPVELPLIRIKGGELPRIVDQAEQALISYGSGLYQRGSLVVRPVTVKIAVSNKREDLAQRLVTVTAIHVAECMTRAAIWEKFDARAKDWVACDCPPKAAETFMAREGGWKLPVLTGVINAPTLRGDGSILEKPGYDAATGLLLDPLGATFPAIPPDPTIEDARAALKLIRDLLADFSFELDADDDPGINLSVAVSAVLTACVRQSIGQAPLHAFTAPVAGSGKSYLVDVVSMIAEGHLAGVIGQGKSDEEAEKRLGATLMAGDRLVSIDNCEHPLGGELLCQMMSQGHVKVRVLGLSKLADCLTNVFVCATGNNLAVVGDMPRRCIICKLDPKMERPELREFKNHPVDTVRQDRGKYIVAALTILRAHHLAGRPCDLTPLASFEEWSKWVAGAIVWLDLVNPSESINALRETDPKLGQLTNVVAQWNAAIGSSRVSAKMIIAEATRQGRDMFDRPIFLNDDLREALLIVAGEGGLISSRRLGTWLAGNKGRIVNGLSIQPDGKIDGIARWKLAK